MRAALLALAALLPPGFPPPLVPADNPQTAVKVELGERLFHDARLSGDGSLACAGCHRPELAFTDGRARAVGATGERHPRSATSLVNAAYNATLGWNDPSLTSLEAQALVPLFNTDPVEMGVAGREDEVLERLRDDRRYRRLFRGSFPDDDEPVSLDNVVRALAAFQRTLIRGGSAYDRWAYGAEPDALSPMARAGARLFFSSRLACHRCHAGFTLSGPVVFEGSGDVEPRFHDTAADETAGAFRAPTLRNVALTAPYMHDGSIPTLEAVIDHYAAGGRARRPSVDPLVGGFEITAAERAALVAFLEALTDEALVSPAARAVR